MKLESKVCSAVEEPIFSKINKQKSREEEMRGEAKKSVRDGARTLTQENENGS